MPTKSTRGCHNENMAGIRCTKIEKARRVTEFVQLLSHGAVTSTLYRIAAEKLGVSTRQADVYIAEARKVIITDINQERHIAVAEMIAVCRTVIQKSLEERQYSNAIGAVNAIARLGGLEMK